MIKIYNNGAWLINGINIIDNKQKLIKKVFNNNLNINISKNETKKNTMSYKILKKHNLSNNMNNLKIKFDKLISHDITFVGIIQTARASGLKKFPVTYVLTNCHNSLCAIGGTINEDDHIFGLTCAKRYGGIYVPPNQAVIHQFARETLVNVGDMILGSDSHTRYGALGVIGIGEGGPELVKQLLNKTYDINMPKIVSIYLYGKPNNGIGPQDIALTIIKTVFLNGYVKNKIIEFVGPGITNLSIDYRIGIDVMTTETTCLSSIWITDNIVKNFYNIHYISNKYKTIAPGKITYYDKIICINLNKINSMIAMPFHPSNVFSIKELNTNLIDILNNIEKKSEIVLGKNFKFTLKNKIFNGKLHVDQAIIAGCAGGSFENICNTADILNNNNIGSDIFTLNIYPASMPIYMEIIKNGVAEILIQSGAVIKPAFCGPCFGAGDIPFNNALSIRHSTRNFPNREGSKIQDNQIASVALMDARSIAATAINKGYLTDASDLDNVKYKKYHYFFNNNIYKNRIFNGNCKKNENIKIQFGPNIKNWPNISPLSDNLLLKIVTVIHDQITTTDELIPSGEISSFRSNPLKLAEYTLSRKDPKYVYLAKEIYEAEQYRKNNKICNSRIYNELNLIYKKIKKIYPYINDSNICIGSAIFAVKPGDGSAREQAASCQKVLGGWANIANEYATKRYCSNLINWGIIPLLIKTKKIPFKKGDYLFLPNIKENIKNKVNEINAYIINESYKKIILNIYNLTDKERKIIIEGCLINYYKKYNN